MKRLPLKEGRICHLQFLREAGRATWGSTRFDQEVDPGVREGISHSLYWAFRGKGKAEQGKQFRIGEFE